MNFNESRGISLHELAETLSGINEKEAADFLALLLKSRRIFVAAEGRSMLMLKAFAQRLRHLGKESYVVGETVTPAIGKGDLLVAASGSGKTSGVLNIMNLAVKYRASVAFITASPASSPKNTASLTITIPRGTIRRPGGGGLMGSAFEQGLLLFCDSICLLLKARLKIPETRMRKKHANLE